ncbi:hypothetical protein DM02DRAFT_657162 [Periconia macrospinosa]|uniref:MADS-box domain-containing protein n=1 Tax=Periconia macrospinosa TaxID=97972 RepID=A0A2V1DKQ8_9PLEO|nr:hypothetical protein DM02DRAFT_657162 [Periconia macrospinosa]
MPPGRRRQVSLEEANERRRKMRQRRKRRFGVIKKVHDLKKDCGFEAVLFLFHPETGQISTYRSTNNEVCDSWFKDIERSKATLQHLDFESVENLLNKPSGGDDLRGDKTSDEEENALDDVRPYQHISNLLHENSENDKDQTTMQAIPSTNSSLAVRISTRQILSPTTEIACGQRELLPVMPIEHLASPRALYLPSMETLIPNPEISRPSIEAGADAAAPGTGTNMMDANILTLHNIRDQAHVPQGGLDDEINRLKEEHDRIRNWKNRLLRLQRLDEEEDEIKRKLEGLQHSKDRSSTFSEKDSGH